MAISGEKALCKFHPCCLGHGSPEHSHWICSAGALVASEGRDKIEGKALNERMRKVRFTGVCPRCYLEPWASQEH